mmetsp:Transcript_39388/g.93252  ORF Transcript_39388/g.93252 Transcript_39388/m.93252 type:complete len:295 (+) Transcript_39388:4481-5365(+)
MRISLSRVVARDTGENCRSGDADDFLNTSCTATLVDPRKSVTVTRISYDLSSVAISLVPELRRSVANDCTERNLLSVTSLRHSQKYDGGRGLATEQISSRSPHGSTTLAPLTVTAGGILMSGSETTPEADDAEEMRLMERTPLKDGPAVADTVRESKGLTVASEEREILTRRGDCHTHVAPAPSTPALAMRAVQGEFPTMDARSVSWSKVRRMTVPVEAKRRSATAGGAQNVKSEDAITALFATYRTERVTVALPPEVTHDGQVHVGGVMLKIETSSETDTTDTAWGARSPKEK